MNSSTVITFWSFVLSVVLFTSCSEYSKILKEKDITKKYEAAVGYYESGECYKALPLLEELLGLTRGSQLAENVYYYYAKTEYCIKDYFLANYYFKSFTRTFSNSPKAEECQFLAALCSYKLSPSYSLDQVDTRSAIDEFQLFLDKYPNSALRDSANNMVGRLRFKLEEKAFAVAKQYSTTRKYKAAAQSLAQFIEDFPGSIYCEEAYHLMVQSNYEYAEGSVESRKLERYRAAVETYLTFASLFPDSALLKDAEVYYIKSRRQIEKRTSTSEEK
ncbi:MAG: outer membrane protein assembly factor BamD [Flavobacteriales bacterium]